MKKLGDDKKRFNEKKHFDVEKIFQQTTEEKKKSIFLLKGIFVKNTVLGKTVQQALENIQELQLHS